MREGPQLFFTTRNMCVRRPSGENSSPRNHSPIEMKENFKHDDFWESNVKMSLITIVESEWNKLVS